jgi:8-oxo-dGTP pyrophosphatase MutT (NUDIX family)
MKERHKTISVVFLILLKKESGKTKILLQLRQNTGYMDNMYDMTVSGHIEENERLEDALIREAKEEIGVDLDKRSIKLVSLDHKEKENYFNFFFMCDNYKGKPCIKEPLKCAKLEWFDINNLPDNLIDHNKRAIERYKNNTFYTINRGNL